MGSQLVKQVEAAAMGGRLDGLPSACLPVLLIMASNALDRPQGETPEAVYFRGWPHLASVLGYQGLTPAGKSRVARAVSALTDAGLVKATHWDRSDTRGNTVYELTLL